MATNRLAETHQLESEYTLKNLKTKKPPGYDLILPILLKEVFKFLTFIFNAILSIGFMPSSGR